MYTATEQEYRERFGENIHTRSAGLVRALASKDKDTLKSHSPLERNNIMTSISPSCDRKLFQLLST